MRHSHWANCIQPVLRRAVLCDQPLELAIDLIPHLRGHDRFQRRIRNFQREITRGHVREVVGKGLQEARGNYKIVARMFNMESGDYKKFLNFLRKHECQLPFREYR